MAKELGKSKATIALLFQVYAKIFPDQKDFWLQLAKEEEYLAKAALVLKHEERTRRRGKTNVQT